MPSNIKNYQEIAPLLGNSKSAWEKLVGFIRVNYVMDETWTSGATTGKLAAYRNELKFRRGGKTLVTLYIRDGYYDTVIILGKAEREVFESRRNEFSSDIIKIYNDTAVLHDGKWLCVSVVDETHIDDIIRLLSIKRKPNRKTKELSLDGCGKCGNRCDLCLLYVKNNEGERADRLLFGEMDWRCYHSADEVRPDGEIAICPGCGGQCSETIACVKNKGFENCGQCDYRHCTAEGEHIYGYDPGRCNLGLTAEEVTRVILPYCGKERFDRMS
jgi:hypothetical protein